jgi:hypothetical protein
MVYNSCLHIVFISGGDPAVQVALLTAMNPRFHGLESSASKLMEYSLSFKRLD